MTIEEKAKAYDEALARAKQCLDKEYPDTCFVRPDIIFPELKESKDERIKKEIIEYLKNERAAFPCESRDYEKWIAWLEKQGEKKAVLDELEMTLSVSEDAYLRENIEKLIKEFKKEQQ